MRNLSSPLDLPGAGAVRPLRGNSFVPQGYPDAAMPAPVSSLEQLKRQPRQPGEASFFYYDPHFQLNSAKVLPGEYFVSRATAAMSRGAMVRTPWSC